MHLHLLDHMHHHIDMEDEPARAFAWLGFLLRIAIASFNMMLPLLLSGFLNGDKKLIGYYLSSFAFIEIAAGILTSYLFVKFSRITVFTWTLITTIFAVLGMSIVSSIYDFAILDIIRLIFFIVMISSLVLFISDVSSKKKLSKNMGYKNRVGNLGSFLGTFAIGYIAADFGNESIFYFVPAVLLIVLIYFKHQRYVKKNKYITHKKYDISIMKVAKSFFDVFKREDLKQVFILHAIGGCWLSLYTSYKPLMITGLGYDVKVIGWVASLCAIMGGIASFFFNGLTSEEKIRKTTSRSMIIVSLMSILLFFLHNLGLSTDYKLPFLIAFILLLFPLSMLLVIRTIHFTFIMSAQDRNKYTAFAIISLGLAKLVFPLMVSGMLSLGFYLQDIWILLAVLTLISHHIFYNRPNVLD